jgi:hypothetical protein
MMLKGRYGEVQSLVLDTKEHSLELKILLNGESDAVDMSIGYYEINDSVPEKPVVVLNQITASRQWMQELAADNIEGKTIEIPVKLAPMIKMVL